MPELPALHTERQACAPEAAQPHRLRNGSRDVGVAVGSQLHQAPLLLLREQGPSSPCRCCASRPRSLLRLPHHRLQVLLVLWQQQEP